MQNLSRKQCRQVDSNNQVSVTVLRNAITSHLHGVVMRTSGGHVYKKCSWHVADPQVNLYMLVGACLCLKSE